MKLHTRHPGFTLVELLVGLSVLVLLFGLLMTASDQLTRLLGTTTAKGEQFRSAREGFERLTTRLSQATLNTYWDYDNEKQPTRYERRSELRFVSGPARELVTTGAGRQPVSHGVFFSAPLGVVDRDAYRGLENLLNVCGWYVEYGEDEAFRPGFVGSEVPPKWRWRLMELSTAAEHYPLYDYTSGAISGIPKARTYIGKDWFSTEQKRQVSVRPLVDNVVALILIPRLARADERQMGVIDDTSPLAPEYRYDSTKTNLDPRLNPKNQLPPVMQVTMVAVDERSMARLGLDAGQAERFGVNDLFKQTARYSKDLSIEGGGGESLEQRLIDEGVSYRIFTTNVHLRGAKWSREQSDKP